MAASRRELLAGGASLALSACGGSERAYAPIAPQPGDALEGLDGVGVVARIRAGDITAAEAAEAAIARAERVQPQLNFIATPAYEMGRLRAAPPPGTPAQQGPLAGLPTFIKDLSPLAGAKFMSGSRAFAENIAARNSPYVEALLAAGVTPLGKTTTPEFGLTATTEPLLTGPTRNPWDAARSSGGSSGGAAVAVAAGVVPVAHGGDGGGSIRIPASCCGLVGLKVSRGRLIDAPADAPVALAVDGCLSRTVRDTAAWIAATERGGQGAPFPLLGLVRGPSQRRLRVGLAVADAAGRAPDPEVAAAVTAAGALCARLGHHVSEVAFDLDAEAFTEAFVLYWAAGAAQAAAQVRRIAPNAPLESLLEPLTLQLADHYARAPHDAFENAVASLRAVQPRYDAMFAAQDVLLTPVLSAPPPPLGYLAPTLPFDVGFARVMDYARYTPLANVAGAPALSLPLGWSGAGLPIGAHFMAARGDERTLLELAYELEIASPWAMRRPPIWAGLA